ncbi:MAG: hypothetical protein PHN90_03280 [Methanothrix sp.]|nr:hypothetical protein [Methanothrix sp.]
MYIVKENLVELYQGGFGITRRGIGSDEEVDLSGVGPDHLDDELVIGIDP